MAERDFQERASGPGLVVGGDSLVGSGIQLQLPEAGIPVEISSRRPATKGLLFDLRDPDFAPLERTRHEFAFVCAAVTDMRACQDEPVLTRRVNVDNTIELMRRLADRGTHLLFLSSSQVFDGETAAPTEDAPTCPKNEYGAQKLAVEEAIARHELPAAILRPTKILASHPVGVSRRGSTHSAKARQSRQRPTCRSHRSRWRTLPGRPCCLPLAAIAASGISAPATR